MASRKEQKQALRREREEREAAAKAAARRRQLIGYGAGLAVALAAVIVAVLLLSGGNGGGGDDSPGGGDSEVAAAVLPDGGSVPEPRNTPLIEASQAAGCELKSYRDEDRGQPHVQDLAETVEYESEPPANGRHYEVPAEDGDYEQAPDMKRLVHSLEHGRVVVWFKKDLPRDVRADLKALYDEDKFQLLLTPDETGSPYEVAATAWNRDPVPNGTGRLMGCEKFSPEVYEAIRAFKDEHRSNGPEPVP